jgi:phosphoglucomutase
MEISPLAGKPAPPAMLVNVPRLNTAYYTDVPDPSIPAQWVRATPKQKNLLARLSPGQFRYTSLAGETIERVLDRALGNAAPIGGLK